MWFVGFGDHSGSQFTEIESGLNIRYKDVQPKFNDESKVRRAGPRACCACRPDEMA
jgi:hypothetical protein